jgi:hypothetical protein
VASWTNSDSNNAAAKLRLMEEQVKAIIMDSGYHTKRRSFPNNPRSGVPTRLAAPKSEREAARAIRRYSSSRRAADTLRAERRHRIWRPKGNPRHAAKKPLRR